MKSTEAFRAFYDASLLPVLQSLEAGRRRLFGIMFLYLLVGMAVAIPLFIYVEDQWFVIPLIIALFGFRMKYNDEFQLQKANYKNQVIAKMITFIDESLEYSSADYVRQDQYVKSKLCLDQFNHYNGDDLVRGKLGKTELCFSELHVQIEKVSRDRDGKEKRTTSTVFQGIFFTADFNKKFIGETIVLPDVAESLLGSMGTWFQKMNSSRPQLVKMEDPDFEKAFVVYSTDQVEARYILSTALMQRILSFKNKSKQRLSVSFIDSQIFIAIPIHENLFEPSFFTSMVNYNRVAAYQKYLSLCVDIVEMLDLNTRIWTKE